MKPLIVKDWTPDWPKISAAAQSPQPIESDGGSVEAEPEETLVRRGRPMAPASRGKLRAGSAYPLSEAEGSHEEDAAAAAALLALWHEENLDQAETAIGFTTAGRARPGPRPKSKYCGVSRHVKGMYNAQLWIPKHGTAPQRQEHVGGFLTMKAAAAAHDLAAIIIKGPNARTNFPMDTYGELWQHLRGQDWPTLRREIRAIVRDDLRLGDPETESHIGGAGHPQQLPISPFGSRGEREEIGTPNLPPAKRARFDSSSEVTISGNANTSPPGEHEVSSATNVRKSGRSRAASGRLMALNGEDPKLLHAPRRKRTRRDME